MTRNHVICPKFTTGSQKRNRTQHSRPSSSRKLHARCVSACLVPCRSFNEPLLFARGLPGAEGGRERGSWLSSPLCNSFPPGCASLRPTSIPEPATVPGREGLALMSFRQPVSILGPGMESASHASRGFHGGRWIPTYIQVRRRGGRAAAGWATKTLHGGPPEAKIISVYLGSDPYGPGQR